MSRGIIAVFGGARSGKSSFAQELAEQLGKSTIYIATAQNKDEEMAERIAKHQATRPETWETVEATHNLAQAIRSCAEQAEVILVDCVSVYLSNLLLKSFGDLGMDEDPQLPPSLEVEILAEIIEVIEVAQDTKATVIFVSNEVGLGIVPLYHSARLYRDVAGRTNQLLAKAAKKAFYVLAGIPLDLKSLAVSIVDVCEEWDYDS